jgi:hypothetical protein
MLADAFVILAALLLASVALTQILVPLFRGEPLFRSFRKSYQAERSLRQQLAQTKRALAEMELEKQLAEHQNELLRRRMEQIESFSYFSGLPETTGGPVVKRSEALERKTPKKES